MKDPKTVKFLQLIDQGKITTRKSRLYAFIVSKKRVTTKDIENHFSWKGYIPRLTDLKTEGLIQQHKKDENGEVLKFSEWSATPVDKIEEISNQIFEQKFQKWLNRGLTYFRDELTAESTYHLIGMQEDPEIIIIERGTKLTDDIDFLKDYEINLDPGGLGQHQLF